MLNLTEQEIEYFKRLAKQQTAKEEYGGYWNPYDLSGGNFELIDCYKIGYKDADIENARYILDLYGIIY
jgi:hypothetical protein